MDSVGADPSPKRQKITNYFVKLPSNEPRELPHCLEISRGKCPTIAPGSSLASRHQGVISKLHTLVTSVSYHVARSKPLRMTGSNLIFHKRNERANNHDYGLLLNGSYKINHARETAVTQTLPIACGQSHEHIPSHQKLGDSFLLFRLKRWIPKTSRCLSNVANATPSVSFSSVHVYGGNRGIRNT